MEKKDTMANKTDTAGSVRANNANGEGNTRNQGPELKRVENPTVGSSKPKLGIYLESPEEYNMLRRINLLVYGLSGVGKTTLAGTAQDVPEMRDCINLDAESGHKVLAYRGDIPRIQVGNYTQFAQAYKFFKAWSLAKQEGEIDKLRELEALIRRVDVAKIEKPMNLNTIIIDSLTEIQKLCMYHILGINPGEDRLDMTPDQPEWQDWGKSYEMVQLLTRSFRDLPFNIIFVAGAQRGQDEKKKAIYEVMLPGKLSSGMHYFVDHVGFYWTFKTEAGKTVRRLFFQPGEAYQAKNRFQNWDGEYIDNPTMQDIWNLETQ